MITSKRIISARDKIADQFRIQCSRGQQLRDLNKEYCACGQYLDAHTPQRGMHGTAAALSVLASCESSEARGIVPRLINYIEHRKDAEPDAGLDGRSKDIEEDYNNVIKLSEALYALSLVGSGVASKEGLVKDFAKRLEGNLVDGKGWDFICGGEAPSLLPTSYAIQALDAHDFDFIKGPIEFLIENLNSNEEEPMVKVFCLYVLVGLKNNTMLPKDFQPKKIFKNLWSTLESLMGQDVEQNLEYVGERTESHRYVRVPWQLYLLSMSLKLSPYRAFSSVVAQQRLDGIINSIEADRGFIYPYSGRMKSSRTNAILYSILGDINKEFPKHPFLFKLFNFVNHIQRFIGSNFVTRSLAIVALIIFVFVVQRYVWGTAKITDLGPEFLGFMITSMLSFRKGK